MQSTSYILKSILIILLISAGCAAHRTRPYVGDKLSGKPGIDPVRIQTLTFPQVRETIVSEGLNLTSLKAKAEITLTSPEINDEFRCKGIVRFQRPGKIRVIGSKLARTAFDMTSDGVNYWFYLPKEKVVYKGRSNVTRKADTDAYIFPDDIASILEYDRLFEGRQAYMETWPTFWLVHVLDRRGEEIIPYGRLMVDRVDNTVSEITIFTPDSIVRVQASFSDYWKSGGKRVPETVRISWPDTDTSLTFYLDDIHVNESLKPEIFHFKKPERAEIIDIN